MPRVRRKINYHGEKGKYAGLYITWERLKELEYFCARYKEYKYHYDGCYNLSSPISDGQPGGNGISCPTEKNGIKAAYWLSLMEMIEQAAIEASPDLYQDLIFALTHHGVGYNYLKTVRGMEHGKNYYYRIRDNFFIILDNYLTRGNHGT